MVAKIKKRSRLVARRIGRQVTEWVRENPEATTAEVIAAVPGCSVQQAQRARSRLSVAGGQRIKRRRGPAGNGKLSHLDKLLVPEERPTEMPPREQLIHQELVMRFTAIREIEQRAHNEVVGHFQDLVRNLVSV